MVKLLAPVLLTLAVAVAPATTAHATRPIDIHRCQIVLLSDTTIGTPYVEVCPPVG